MQNVCTFLKMKAIVFIQILTKSFLAFSRSFKKTKVKIGSEASARCRLSLRSASSGPKNCTRSERARAGSLTIPRTTRNYNTCLAFYSVTSQGYYWHSGTPALRVGLFSIPDAAH